MTFYTYYDRIKIDKLFLYTRTLGGLMARSRNYQKSRKCPDAVWALLNLRRKHDNATGREVKTVVRQGDFKPERAVRVGFYPVKRIFLDEPNLLIEIRRESAHVMPARG